MDLALTRNGLKIMGLQFHTSLILSEKSGTISINCTEGMALMIRLITVVCRHNQARSVIAAATLSRYFPEVSVISAGIAAVDGQRIPQSVLNLADNWGLVLTDLFSHSLDAERDKILGSEFVIVAEDEFIPFLLQMGVDDSKILSMQDKHFDHSVVPFDPIGQVNRVVSVEIAKAVLTSAQLLRMKGGFTRKNRVTTLFSTDEKDFQDKLESAWVETVRSNGILLLSDFRAPSFQGVSKVCDYVLEFRVSRINGDITVSDSLGELALNRALASNKPFAISGRFELDQVEKLVLSVQFIEFVANLAANRTVIALTEPSYLGPLAFLVAAGGDS